MVGKKETTHLKLLKVSFFLFFATLKFFLFLSIMYLITPAFLKSIYFSLSCTSSLFTTGYNSSHANPFVTLRQCYVSWQRAHPFALHPLLTYLLFFKCRFVTFGCHLCERHSVCACVCVFLCVSVCLCVFAPFLSPCGACVYGFLIVCLCLKNLPAPLSAPLPSLQQKNSLTFFFCPRCQLS